MSMLTSDIVTSGYVTFLLVTTAVCVLLLGLLTWLDTSSGAMATSGVLFRHLAPRRMQEMLQRRRVALHRYLREQSPQQLRHQVHACDECPRKLCCDDVLASAPTTSIDYSFCPNHRAMERFIDHG